MKVLNVNMSLDAKTAGGTAERTLQMSRSLVAAGTECTILTTDLGLTPERLSAMEGIRVIGLPCLSQRFYIPRFSYRLIERLIADADIVHLMNHWTFLNALVYTVAKRLNKPYVVCPAGSLMVYNKSRMIKRLYNRIIGERIIRNADGHIAVTADEIRQFQAYGLKADKISIIANGINAKNFQAADTADFRRAYGLGDHPFILFMGRLNPVKGPDLLLRAFCNIKDELYKFHLVLAGPDEGMLAELKEMAAAHGVGERVHFVGYLGGTDKSQAYHAADLLVIPSRHEAMSIVALEAGITATPVLLTDQCGFDDVATIGGGQVVPASVLGLQEGLVELLKDPDQLKVQGVNLKRYVCEHFAWDSVVNKYLDLYRQILTTKQ
jgi:glycosyltransferase involved in cell wall biosynthesis